jgi:hypothetical protein
MFLLQIRIPFDSILVAEGQIALVSGGFSMLAMTRSVPPYPLIGRPVVIIGPSV